MREAVDWVTGEVQQAVSRDEAVPHAALSLLLRRYAATGRSDLYDLLGPALSRALQDAAECLEPDAVMPAGVAAAVPDALCLLAEAAAVSDDERLRDVAARLAAALAAMWPSRGAVTEAMRAVDACLTAAPLLDPPQLVARAVDELERVVSIAYEPGEGIGPTVDARADSARRVVDQVSTAAALLSAFDLTARLPYAMLAEELMRFAQTLNPEPGTLNPDKSDAFLTRCSSARVLHRLAALHDDPDYREAAVIAPGADYARDARAVLESIAGSYRHHGIAAAIFAIAVDECFDLQ